MRKRGLCYRPVSGCPSRWWIVSRRLKISSNFFLSTVAHHSSFFSDVNKDWIGKDKDKDEAYKDHDKDKD